MSSVQRGHSFALSEKSIRLHRDTFIFRPNDDAVLLGGLYQRVTKASSRQIKNWVEYLFPKMRDIFTLEQVTVHRANIFSYYLEHFKITVPWDQKEPLAEGYYALCCAKDTPTNGIPLIPRVGGYPSYYAGTVFPHYLCGAWPVDSYADKEEKIRRRPEIYEDKFLEKVHLRNKFKIDEQTNLKILAMQRDKTTCLITDTTGDVQDVSWIVPPAFMQERDYWSEGYKTYKDVRMLSNCITMRKELVTPFLENAFGIDVNDDFRIVIFGNVDERTRNLLEDAQYADRLRQACASEREDAPKRCFLLAHFRQCLCSHFLGGDILEEYGDLNEIVGIMEYGEQAADDDPFWDMVPGREFRAAQEIFSNDDSD